MKSLLSFGLPFVLRVMIPGVVGALIFSPLLAVAGINFYAGAEASIDKLGISLPNIGLIFTGFSLLIGFLLSFTDDTMYKTFEGLICWPEFFRRFMTKRLNNKIKNKLKEDKAIKDENDKRREKIWYWLRKFPLNEEKTPPKPEAKLPTMLGNILRTYEDYPKSRYGMDSIFFWPRLWLSLDSETRKEISEISAEADCVIYISFVCFWGFIFYLLSAILVFLFAASIFPPEMTLHVNKQITYILKIKTWFPGLAIGSLIFSYFFYRMSLPLHFKYGHFFQALFDLYRDRLEKMTQIEATEKELKNHVWENTWAYLEYKIKK